MINNNTNFKTKILIATDKNKVIKTPSTSRRGQT